MREVLTRLRQTLLLEREAFVWMDFNDRATGDALLLVITTGFLKFVLFYRGFRSRFITSGAIDTAISFLIGNLIQWLVLSFIAWAIVRYFIQAEGNIALYLRMTGFVHATTVLAFVVAYATNSFGLLAFLAGFAWFVVIMGRGIEYASSIDRQRATFVALGTVAALIVINVIIPVSPII